MRLAILLVFLLVYTFDTSDASQHLSHRQIRKLLKILIAAALIKPSGVGGVPIPLPFPIPFSIEAVKPPILHPFPSGKHFGSGFGGYSGYGGYGGFAASEPSASILPPNGFMPDLSSLSSGFIPGSPSLLSNGIMPSLSSTLSNSIMSGLPSTLSISTVLPTSDLTSSMPVISMPFSPANGPLAPGVYSGIGIPGAGLQALASQVASAYPIGLVNPLLQLPFGLQSSKADDRIAKTQNIQTVKNQNPANDAKTTKVVQISR